MILRTINFFPIIVSLVILAYFANVIVRMYELKMEYYGEGFWGLCIVFLVGVFFLHQKLHKSTKPWKALIVSSFFLYVGYGLLAGTVPYSDFSSFYKQAGAYVNDPNLRLLDGTKSTATLLYYAAVFWLLGKSLFSAYIGAALAWSMSGMFVYKSATNVNMRESKKLILLVLFLFSPSTVFYAPVISSESVFVLFSTAGFYFFTIFWRDRTHTALAIASLLFALVFLTRANGGVLFISMLIWLFYLVVNKKVLLNGRLVVATILPFALLLSLQGLLHYSQTGKISVTPSQWGAYLILTGTSKDNNGGFSREQLELAGFSGENKVSHQRASDRAIEIVKERLTNQPNEILEFALTGKIDRLWAGVGYSLTFSLKGSDTFSKITKSGTYRSLARVADGFFFITLASFALWLFLFGFKNPYIGLFCVPVIGYCLLHLLAEVQPRYIIPFMPFIYTGATLMITSLFDYISPPSENESSDSSIEKN